VPDPDPVYWGHMSLLNSDLRCLKLLLAQDKEWKYYMNLAGSEMLGVPIEVMEQMIDQRLQGGSYAISNILDPKRIKYKYMIGNR
jgi:hypothetical protein